MAPILFALFVIVPIIEIALFIQVGGWIGVWPTIGLVILTAMAGTSLLRAQGLSTMRRAQESMNQGQLPMREVFDGACLLVAGVLLLTPGFMTDAMGLALFVPAVRSGLLAVAAKAVKDGRIHVQSGFQSQRPEGFGSDGFRHGGFGSGPSSTGPTDLEGEYREVNPTDGSSSPSDRADDPPRHLDHR